MAAARLINCMRQREGEKIRLGVSSCLLGEEVRHDGGHKKDAFLTETLGPFVEWVPVCPEVELGLGIPRDTIRLVGDATAPRLVVQRTGEDLTARMRRYAEARTRELEALDLHGYVLKRASPSCGLFRVRVHRERGRPGGGGRGLYADALVRRFPMLPVEEEGRLTDAAIRENFIERIFAAARWRALRARPPRPRDLVAFHAAQKFAVLAHSPAHWARLARLAAAAGPLTHARLTEYGTLFMEALAVHATRARHARVLRRLAGAVTRELDAPSRAELAEVIHDYRRGLVPLVVPLTLVKHSVRRLDVAYLADQVYLTPHPKELTLRNHV
jgi:uncharacterized protein YbbK (DUF523 family)/uncharacterized protein YbgA (DUF1722 family)